jgi:hypothetical protein
VGGDINFTGNLYKSASLFQTGVGWSNNGSNIFSNSNIGIGTSIPNARLHVYNASTAVRISVGNSNNYADIGYSSTGGDFSTDSITNDFIIRNMATANAIRFNFGTGAAAMSLNSTGLAIGLATPSYKLHVSGDIYATGDITAFSDVKAKENLVEIPNALDKVKQLTGYTYDMPAAERKKRYTGLIAQDVQKVLPEAVNESGNGDLGIAYGNLSGMLVQAIKEMECKYENKIMDLEKQLGERDKQLSDIWSKLNSL